METVCLAIVPLLLIVSVDLFSLLYYWSPDCAY